MIRQMKAITQLFLVFAFFTVLSVTAIAGDSVQLGDVTNGCRDIEILFNEPLKDKDVILALYDGEKILDSHIIEDVDMTGNRLLASAGSLDEADTVKAFVFNSLEKVQPYCEPVTVNITDEVVMPRAESYLLIDALGIGYLFDNGKLALPSGWVSYNKNLGNITNGVHTPCVSDESKTDYSALYRDFDAVSEGRITLEFFGAMFSENDGIYIGFSDPDGNTVCSVSADYGEFLLAGKDSVSTGIPFSTSELAEYAISLEVDLDSNVMSACINGMYTHNVTLPEEAVLSCLVLSSTVEGTGYMLPKHVRMYSNYAMAERFLIHDIMAGKQVHSMNVCGDITYEEYETISQDDKYSAKVSAKAHVKNEASKGFAGISEKGIFESMIFLPDGADGAFFTLTSKGKDVVSIVSKDGAWYVGDRKMRDFAANVWQTLRIETDLNNNNAVIKICGKTVGEVPICAEYIDGIRIGINSDADTIMWFDDIVAYNYVDHADYPAEPVANNDDGYNIGINVCNLWHDANTKEGWQVVSPFAELEPWLGYYDEGSPELADWEIKIMAEHGIDFQHFCWYQPQKPVESPIKVSDVAHPAIHDGYMNAKYSDMVKFAIMWENAISPKSSLEDFREYIWNYWKEYYFSDPRYMTIENKPVLSVWSYSSFKECFGGVEGAKEALEFMREDIKTLGYDGLIFLTKSSMEESEIGADAGYFYHYSKEGCSADYQINTLEGYKDSPLHAIPTLAIGHNGIGRYDYREPLISLEGHKQVAEYIKNDYLASRNTGTWKDNTLLVSTWNEYSEGHYICPSGEFGYGYLENIKDVFTNDNSDHTSLDIKPTDAQKDRITKMYPNTHQPIRILRNETEEIEKMPIAKWDFSNEAQFKEWLPNMCVVVDGKSEKGIIFHAIAPDPVTDENGVTTTSIPDPQFYKYNANISLSQKPLVHIRMRADKQSNIDVFFTTYDYPEMEGNIKRLSTPLKNIGEMVDYYIDMSAINEWSGTLKDIRIDPVSVDTSFEIEVVELLVPKNTDEIVLAEWDFSDENVADKWGGNKYNKTISVDAVSDTGLLAHGILINDGYDPQLSVYNLSIDLSQKPFIYFRMRTESKTSAQFFYATDTGAIHSSRTKKVTLEPNGEFVDYYVDMSSANGWDGTLKTLRFDPCGDNLPFEIEYMKIFIPKYQDGKVFVNGNEMRFDFRTVATYEDMEVTANPDLGFFTMLNLHYTWNRYTGKLYVESDHHSLEFTVGSSKVTLDGVQQNLGYNFTLRDGLPVLKIKDFCEMLGFDVTVDGNEFHVDTGRTPIVTETEDCYGWEFNSDGNTEGWYSYDTVLHCVNGNLCVEDPTHFDMHIFPPAVSIDSSVYTKLAVGIYVDPEIVKGHYFQMFFKAGKQSLDEAKSYKHRYDTSVMSKDKLYEFEIDLTQNENWYGIINDLRVDICNKEVECKIDYIRFLK